MELNIKELIEKTTTRQETTNTNLEKLQALRLAMHVVQQQERYKDQRPPIIAGGAIRDTFFGLPPNDWDIFLDISHIEPEEAKEDYVMLYLSDLLEQAKKSEILEPELINASIEALDGMYVPDETLKHWNEKKFVVYQTGWTHVEEWPETILTIQTIGRNDKRLSGDPIDFLDDFDYPAVKCLYDTKTSDFVLHPDFLKFLETRIIESDDQNTLNRILNWKGRFWPTTPFEVVDTRKKETINKNDWLAWTNTVSTANTWVTHPKGIFEVNDAF